jgi:hypothetical protein
MAATQGDENVTELWWPTQFAGNGSKARDFTPSP